MAIEIEGPDGAVIEFPDGTDDTTIKSAMARAYPNRFRDMVENRPKWIPKWWAQTAATINASGEGQRQGATLGFGDELLAMLPDLAPQSLESTIRGGPRTFTERAEDYRGGLEEAREFAPGATMAGEIAGGVALPIPGAATSNLVRAAGTGGALGAAYGAGSSEGGLGERAPAALAGGALGATVGGGLYGAGKGASAALQGLRNARMPAEQRAAEMASRRMTQGGRSAQTAQAELNRLRNAGGAVEEALMDESVGGANVQGLARAAANVQGPGKEIIRQRLIERSVGPNPDRVTNENLQGAARRIAERGWSQMTGSRRVPGGGNYNAMVRAVNEQAQQTAAPLYQQATATPFPRPAFDQSFLPLFRDPAIGGVWRKTAARALRSVRGQAGTGEQRALAALARGQAPQQADLTVGVLHRLRRAVNDEIGAAARSGERGLSADLINFRNQFMDPWIEGIPGAGQAYRTARETVHAGHQMTEALQDGQSIFTMPEGRFWERVAGLSGPEREAFALGAMRSVIERAGRNPNARDAIKIILSGNMRERLRAVWPTDASGSMRPVNDFFRRLMRERGMQETTNYILGGSRTAPLSEEIADATVREAPMGAVLDEIEAAIRGGNAAQPFRNAAAGLLNRFRRPGLYNEGINREVSTLLSRPLSDDVIARLTDAERRLLARQTARRGGGRAAALVGTAATRRED